MGWQPLHPLISDDGSGEIGDLTEKATPVDADLVLIEDSEASGVYKKAQLGNLPGGGGGGNGATTEFKAADESVASSTTLQDDDDLVFAIGANEVWVVRYVLFPTCASAAVDIKTNITVPTGATGRRNQFGPSNTATATGDFTKGQQFDLDGSTALSAGVVDSTSTELPLYLDAYISNGANAGNVTLQWAQLTSSATALTLREGSHLVAHQVA